MNLPLPPELRCKIYRNITNFPDIYALLTIYQRNPEELSLIYDCITTIENVPVRFNFYVNLDFIGKFRNLRNLNAPIYIVKQSDISRVRSLHSLTKVSFIIDIFTPPLEIVINQLLDVIPENLENIYFTDPGRLILYHYNKEENFFAISTYNINSIFNDTLPNISTLINRLAIDELYLRLPSNSRYIDNIVEMAIAKSEGNMWISCPAYLLEEILPIANNILVRYETYQNQLLLIDLEEELEPDVSYPNVVTLHGPFLIDSILNVQDQLPNLQEIGIFIPDNQPLNLTTDKLTLLNPDITLVIFYGHPSRRQVVEQYFRRSEFYHEFHDITEIRDYSTELYIDAHLR